MTTLTPELRAGAALASALMAANYPGDSGEDVDRLIAELVKRGYRLQSDDDDDAILRAVAEARAAHIDALMAAVPERMHEHDWQCGNGGHANSVESCEECAHVLAILRGEHD